MDIAITSLTAKVTPPSILRSYFNPSFLITFTATLGRTVGCFSITLADLAHLGDIDL